MTTDRRGIARHLAFGMVAGDTFGFGRPLDLALWLSTAATMVVLWLAG